MRALFEYNYVHALNTFMLSLSQELTLVTKPGEGFGLSLSGGVNGYLGNPLDETDEGIFIHQVCELME